MQSLTQDKNFVDKKYWRKFSPVENFCLYGIHEVIMLSMETLYSYVLQLSDTATTMSCAHLVM